MQTNITLGEFTEMAFRRVCELEGTTPEQVFERAARNAIASYLDHVETGADPGMLRDRERRERVFAQFLAEGGDQLRVWPHTESNKPESFEAAVCQAKQRGREIAEELHRGGHLMARVGDNTSGNVYHDPELSITVFEDLEGDAPRYYAWRGTWDDHDSARHTAVCDRMGAAVAALAQEPAARLTRE